MAVPFSAYGQQFGCTVGQSYCLLMEAVPLIDLRLLC